MSNVEDKTSEALARLNAAKETELRAYSDLKWAEKATREAAANYEECSPLTIEEREDLAIAVAAGQPLCCESGAKWLKERLPEPWAEAINNWAYNHLGCHPGGVARTEQAVKVRALRRDQFPPGY
jgi:hypothetical protein